MQTREQAITTAKIAAASDGKARLVTARTAHPFYPGQTVHLIIAKDAKRAWAADEELVFHSDYPDDLTAAWYALDCPPAR